MDSNTIILIGPMGVGKTTVGKQMADLLDQPFFDADTELEKQTGASISWIFDKEGESGFRKREEKIIANLCAKENIILATGGGAILSTANRKIMKQTGIIVYITAELETLLARTAKDKSRPLLQQDNPRDVLSNLLQIRNPLYESIADISVLSTNSPSKLIAKKIIERIELLNQK